MNNHIFFGAVAVIIVAATWITLSLIDYIRGMSCMVNKKETPGRQPTSKEIDEINRKNEMIHW